MLSVDLRVGEGPHPLRVAKDEAEGQRLLPLGEPAPAIDVEDLDRLAEGAGPLPELRAERRGPCPAAPCEC